MKVCFLIPCRSYIPSGAVRVLQYEEYLKAKSVHYKIFNYYSPTALRLSTLSGKWFRKNNFCCKVIRHSLARVVKAIEHFHWRHEGRSILNELENCDCLFIQWVLPPQDFVAKVLLKAPIVYDFDDAVFLIEPDQAEYLVKKAKAVIAGSHFNFDYASKINSNATLIPSSVPLEKYPANITRADDCGSRSIRIGWIGSISTAKYLGHLVEPLSLLARDGYLIKIVIAGTWGAPDLVPKFEGVLVEEVPFYDAESLPALVSSFDIGVMPADDTPWEKGKCAMKALLYMAGGKPVVCSPVGEIAYIVQNGINGYLAKDAFEWKSALQTLIYSRPDRARMGENARRTIEKTYSSEICFHQLYTVLSQVSGTGQTVTGI